ASGVSGPADQLVTLRHEGARTASPLVPVGGRDVTTCGSGRCLLPALDRLSRGRCSAESVQLLQPTPPRPGKTCARAGGCCRSAVSAQRERTAGPRQVAQVPVQKSEPATPGRSGKRRSRQDEGRSGAEKVLCDVMGHGVKTMAWPPECWRTTLAPRGQARRLPVEVHRRAFFGRPSSPTLQLP